MEDIVLFLTSFVFVLLLCGVQCTELCYTDPNSNTGVYCSNNCCGSYPQIYCCDKDEFITQSAVFGGVAVVFIVVLVTCIVVRKVKEKPEVDPLAAMKKPKVDPLAAMKKPKVDPLATMKKPKVDPLAAMKKPKVDPLAAMKKPKVDPLAAMKKPEVDPLAAMKKPEVDPLAAMKKPRSNSVGPIVSVVPENDDPSAAKAPTSEDQHQPSPQAPISTITVVSPPSYDQAVQLPSEAMSDDRVNPSPATPGSPKPTPSSTPR